MTNPSLRLIAPLAIAAVLSACAAAPGATGPQAAGVRPPAGCAELGAEIGQLESARRAALEKEQGAWKAVVPFAVAARYASGKKAAGEAAERLATLHAESARQGCGSHGQ